jgi:hypothetical protein
MITVLRAELALLRCRWMLIGGVLIAAGFGVITTLANFLSAQPAASSPPGRGTTLEALGAAGGATEAFRVGTGFLGVLVVVVFAARMATGRLHHALVRRRRSPSRRGRLPLGDRRPSRVGHLRHAARGRLPFRPHRRRRRSRLGRTVRAPAQRGVDHGVPAIAGPAVRGAGRGRQRRCLLPVRPGPRRAPWRARRRRGPDKRLPT